MKLSEKIDIVYLAVEKHVPAKQIAKKHRITVSYVSLLVKKARKNP